MKKTASASLKAARIIVAADKFARAWEAWADTPVQMPDDATIEAAGELCAALKSNPITRKAGKA